MTNHVQAERIHLTTMIWQPKMVLQVPQDSANKVFAYDSKSIWNHYAVLVSVPLLHEQGHTHEKKYELLIIHAWKLLPGESSVKIDTMSTVQATRRVKGAFHQPGWARNDSQAKGQTSFTLCIAAPKLVPFTDNVTRFVKVDAWGHAPFPWL